MGQLTLNLRTVLESLSRGGDAAVDTSLLVRAYNNDQSLYRIRNRRPRTDLMVKGLRNTPFEKEGLIAHVARRVADCSGEVSFERYVDVGLMSGEWWRGTARWELIAEVENNWAELRGTLSDLLNTQAKRKWAIFYSDDVEGVAEEVAAAVRDVRGAFADAGFQEADSTLYEILILPDYLPAEGLLGVRALELVFQGDGPAKGASPAKVTI